MFELICRLFDLFFPSRGKDRPEPTPEPTLPRPVRRTWDSAPLDAEEVAMVQPYVAAWERERARMAA